MAYLERKSMRNQAKTRFTECLDAIEVMMNCCQDGRSKKGTTIESATHELIKAVSVLHADFFTKNGDDKEIRSMKEELLKKLEGLNDYFDNNRDRIKEQGLEAQVQSVLAEIAKAAKRLSEV